MVLDRIDRGRLARAAVALTFFCHGLFFAAWTAHIPHVKAALGLSAGELGLVLLAGPLGAVSALTLAARLLPRWGSRRAVRGAVIGYCVAGVFVGLARSAALLFAGLFVWGAFQAVLDVAMNTQAIAVERRQGRRLMSGLHGGWSLGSFSGAGLGAAAVGAGISLSAQQAILSVPIVLAVGALSLGMVDDVPAAPAREPSQEPAPPRPGRRRLVFSPTILTLAAIAFAGLLCEGAAADWSAVYLRSGLRTSAAYAGLAYTAFSLMMVAVRLAGNRLSTRLRPDRVLAGLAAFATLGTTVGLLAGTPVTGILGFACLGAGLGSIVPQTFSAAGRVPGLEVGAAVSTVAALSFTGFVLGPPMIGALSGLATLRFALLVLPLMTGAIAVLTARTRALRAQTR